MFNSKGLSSVQSSFLFKLLHQLLPVQDRIKRITYETGSCKHSSSSPVDDRNQALFQCEKSISASDDRIQCIRFITPNRTAKDLLHLELSEISCITTKYAVMNIIATGLYYIWKSRCEKKSAQSYKMRADIEASILIESKFT